MGTMIQARDLSAADFGGPQLEGCNENLNLTRPDVIRDIHAAYLDAGADLISTNTFGCAPYVLAEYGLWPSGATRSRWPPRGSAGPRSTGPPPPSGRASPSAPWARGRGRSRSPPT